MNRAISALQFVSPVERETWIQMGMALRSEFGDAALDAWMDWSRQADSFRESAALSAWRSFKGAGVTMGTLIHLAKQNGWRDDDKFQRPSSSQMALRNLEVSERLNAENQARIKAQQAAAKKAGWILHQTIQEQHAYLQSKGWPEAKGAVWWPNPEQNLLCIPMRVGRDLVGVQLIDRTGSKRYLSGQRTSGAEYVIANNGPRAIDWWVEGFATALSLRDCLQALRLRYRIHVTFSAGNLKGMATEGVVVADNDESRTGENAAIATGLPYLLPPKGDFNDWIRADGVFKTSQAVRKWLNGISAAPRFIPNGSQTDPHLHTYELTPSEYQKTGTAP